MRMKNSWHRTLSWVRRIDFHFHTVWADILMSATTAPCSAGLDSRKRWVLREQRQVIQRSSIHEKPGRVLEALSLNIVVQDLLISPVPPCWQLKCLFCSLVCPENSPELQELLRLEGLLSLLAPDLVSGHGWKIVWISESCERLQDHCTIAS